MRLNMSHQNVVSDTNLFSFRLSTHAKAICNLVSFNNAYSKVILDDSNYVKITQNKALEFIANAVGYNTYKGLLENFDQTVFHVQGKKLFGPIIEVSQANFEQAFTKHFGNKGLNLVLKNLSDLIYQYLCIAYDLSTEKDPTTFFGLAFMKFSHWNDVAKAYLNLNAPSGLNFNSKEVFALLSTANALSIMTNGVADLEDLMLMDIEDKSFIANNPKEYKSEVSKALSVLTFQCFAVLSKQQHIYLKRDVEYYTALALNDERVQPNYIQTVQVEQSKKDKEMFKFTNMLITYMGQPAIASEIVTETLIDKFHPHIPFEHKTYGQMALQLKLLNGCTTLQDWLCMNVRPSNIQPMVWSSYIVDYYNYMMDEFKSYFMHHVENEHYNIKNIYFNDAGLLMYKSDTKFQLRDGNSISANDFCLVANVVNSRSCARMSKGSTFGRYMMYYTYFLFRECKSHNRGIDNEVDLWNFSD